MSESNDKPVLSENNTVYPCNQPLALLLQELKAYNDLMGLPQAEKKD